MPARAKVALLVTGTVIAGFVLAACDSSSNEEVEQLQQELDQSQADLAAAQEQNEALQAQLDDTQSQLADTQTELEATQTELADTQTQLTQSNKQLKSTQSELGTTQAELLDAQAQLARVGEVVLKDGTYVGQVLGAKASPYRVIVFNAAGLFRVAQVSPDVKITAGGDDYTLSQFGKLLSSTDPDDAKLANGNYQVIVKKSVATSIRKSKA